MKLVLKYIKPYKVQCFIAFLMVIIDVFCALYIPTLTAKMINVGLKGKDLNFIFDEGLIMFICAVIAGICSSIGSYVCASLASIITRDLRNAIYNKTLKFKESDYKKFTTATLTIRNVNDAAQINRAVMLFIQIIFPVPIICIIGIILTAWIDWIISLFLLGVIVAVILFSIIISKNASKTYIKMQNTLDKMSGIIREDITGVRVIRAFTREQIEENNMNKSFESYATASIKVNKMFARLDSFSFFALNFCLIFILWFASNKIGIGNMNIGDITALTQYTYMILLYLMMAQTVILILPRSKTCLNRVKEILEYPLEETKKEIIDMNDKITNEAIEKNKNSKLICSFVNVFFKYENEYNIKDLSFTLNRGETTAIIGQTGCGKSTVAKLLLKHYLVNSGEIILFDHNINLYNQKKLSNIISYIPQKAWLFFGTIAENLKVGKKDATEEEMWNALKIAQAEEFVKNLDEKLNSHVAQGGSNFSGGQRQRLSIARALIKKSDIYIFDDSFSALDYKTDSILRDTLKQEIKNSAILIIAQRISTIINADQIIVIDEGKTVGIGTHDELIKNCKLYLEIANSQMKEVNVE